MVGTYTKGLLLVPESILVIMVARDLVASLYRRERLKLYSHQRAAE